MNRDASPRSRRRRSEDIARRLAAARARNLDQISAVREDEKAQRLRREQKLRDQQRAVDAALESYLDAVDAITTAEQATAATIADLDATIARARAGLSADIAAHRQSQARAAWRIQQAGRRVDDIAALLDISRGTAARLVATGRAHPADDANPVTTGKPAPRRATTTEPSARSTRTGRGAVVASEAATDDGGESGARGPAGPRTPEATGAGSPSEPVGLVAERSEPAREG